jgi:hypothetical protein
MSKNDSLRHNLILSRYSLYSALLRKRFVPPIIPFGSDPRLFNIELNFSTAFATLENKSVITVDGILIE